MTITELRELLEENLPSASLGEDSDGQVIIYTNLREDRESEELVTFNPEEEEEGDDE